VDLDTAVAALAPRLVAYATGRTGCRSTGEDIAQEALTALVIRWRRVGPPESPEAFVFAIAKRRAGRAALRRALMRPLDAVVRTRASEPHVVAFERRDELAAVRRLMNRLRAPDREVLLLRAVGQLSLEAIAAVTHSSVPAVKMRLHRARKRLTELLQESRDVA
jgi:RNA polymerase sigma-70 factor (ECF subfamily)